MLGYVFHIQRFSLFDGPGVRTVVFLKGCPLRCIWCHNPEGLEKVPQIMFDSSRCIGCGECSAVCPEHHIMQDGLHGYERSGCMACGRCAEVCPTGALSVAGKRMSVDEVMEEVMRDFDLYRESGGGITLSGGEPLYQSEFSIALLRAAKEAGLTTCIETCGHVSTDVIWEAAKYTDDFYYDYKATGDEEHCRLCGVPATVIRKNLKALDELSARVTLRCPIVPGQNETPGHIEGIGKTAAAHTSVHTIHLEPYHRLGKSKAQKLGQAAFETNIPERLAMEQYCREIMLICGKQCLIS